MEEFTQGNQEVEFTLEGRAAAHGFIEAALKAQRYRSLSKGQRGIVRFLARVTGLSRAQLTRLLSRWRRTRHVADSMRLHPKCGRSNFQPATNLSCNTTPQNSRRKFKSKKLHLYA